MRDPLAAPDLRRSSVAFDVVVAGLVGFVVAMSDAGTGPQTYIAGGLITVALAVRRVAPSAMMTAAVASAVVQVAMLQVTALSVMYAPMFFTAGGHPDRRVRRGSFGVAVVGSIVAGGILPHAYGDFALGDGDTVWGTAFGIVGSAVFVVGGWTAGFVGYQRRSVAAAEVSETIAELERRRMLDLYDEQSERSRLARDMHDVVAHSLAVVIAQAEGAKYTLAANPDAARDALGVIADTARDALADVRTVLEELRSTETVGEVSRADRDQLFARMRAAGMTIEATETGSADDTDAATVHVAHAVLTESLTNALKYGDLARPVRVAHDWTDGCRLTVGNTVAADPLAPGGARHGIIGMTERAAHVGGSLSSTRTDDGWLVVLTIPASEGPTR
ncbi:sensor histidine kinase [Gordonia liuliyuniae]|uniref:histidine kinase n=1 Tax=Gordonia liuliyuniae TaxID=2911517 RepID=A0ABS9IV16_9ACTN|nr:histidine kinase [Gordonia liuliyuniae]MCF8589400.1 histidine kinase [Gordonia liuliyuniae]